MGVHHSHGSCTAGVPLPPAPVRIDIPAISVHHAGLVAWRATAKH